VNHSSLAFDQAVDSANMPLYAVYQQLTPDVSLVTRYSFTCNSKGCETFGKLRGVAASLDNFDLFYTGGGIDPQTHLKGRPWAASLPQSA